MMFAPLDFDWRVHRCRLRAPSFFSHVKNSTTQVVMTIVLC
uniref:Uncharacterized protein n=1 Tax=Arundo donax TaxID=35708 RepID=A0A0A8ZD32_ARUDO